MTTGLSSLQPVDSGDVRLANLAVVLRQVRRAGPCSRADIAAATGLNKATVSSLVADLIERRMVREVGLTDGRVGRPATMLVLDGTAYAAIGMEVNADYISAVALDLAGAQLLSWRRSFAGLAVSPDRAVAATAALARRVGRRVERDGRAVLGLTLGVPGLVEADGSVHLAPNLAWRGLDLRSRLAAELGKPAYPIAVDNDANLAASAEYRYGAHAGTPDLAYLTGEVGIGTGIIAGGRLLRGARGFAGELGHVQLDPAGPQCACGRRGCLEALVGITAVLRRVVPEAFADRPPTDWEPEVAEVVRHARAGDSGVLEVLADVGDRLGRGAAIVANLVNPEVIVLGGYFVPLAPWMLPAAQNRLREETVAADAGGARIVASALGQRAAAAGGAARVLEEVDSGALPRMA